MPEIDLRKLREMQLAQSQSPSPSEEESSHNTSSLGSEGGSGIIDLGVSSSVSPVHLENSVFTKPVKKDVWIDIPHERVMETPEDTGSVKAKPIKISLSSLSQHQKQKDPERLYQEKEEALGKIFGDTTEIVQESSNVGPSLADNNVQEVPQNIQTPIEMSVQQDVTDPQKDHDGVMLSSSDHSEVSDTSHESVVAVIAPETVSQTDLQFPQSEIYPDVDSSSGVSTIIPQTENIQMQQEYPIESISEGAARDRANDISSAGVAASTEAGFFPELSFITPISISKPEDLGSDVAPGENDTIVSNESVTPLIDATPPQEAVTSSEQEPQEVLSHSEAALIETTSPIEGSQSSSSDEVSVLGEAAVMPQDISISETVEGSSVLAETSPPNETPPQEGGAPNLHETNKKSLRWVISGVVVMLLTLGGGGFYIWNNQSQISVSTPNNETDETIINIADLPKNSSSTGTLTGAIMTGSILTGTTIETTGSTVLIGTGMMNTSSGVLIGSGLMSSSGGISMSGVTSTGVLVQSGTIKPTPSSGSGTVGNSGSLVSNTSTGKVITSTGSNTSTGKTVTGTGSSTSELNTSTGSTVITPVVTPPKYLEGRDYKVYGGGYKLVKKMSSVLIGSGKTRVTIFFDYRDPSSQQFHSTHESELLKRANENKITLEFKNYPLPMHTGAYEDALGAFCAVSEGKFLAYHNAIYRKEVTRTNEKSGLSSTQIALIAGEAGLDRLNMQQCIDDKRYAPLLEQEKKEGDAFISGFPIILFDGKVLTYDDRKDQKAFLAIIDSAIVKAK